MPALGPMELVVILTVALFVIPSYILAGRKGYPAVRSACLAFLLGPFVLLALVIVPSRGTLQRG